MSDATENPEASPFYKKPITRVPIIAATILTQQFGQDASLMAAAHTSSPPRPDRPKTASPAPRALTEIESRLAELSRARRPKSGAAAIVGSYSLSRPFSDDLDVAVFDGSLGDGVLYEEAHTLDVDGRSWGVDLCVRPFEWLEARPREGVALLLNMREMRKIIHAKILFDDDGALTEMAQVWRAIEIPPALVERFYDKAAEIDPGARCDLYCGVENIAFGWMHSRMDLQYSKAKWLLWDAKLVGSPVFDELLAELSREIAPRAGDYVARLAAMVEASEVKSFEIGTCKSVLRDAANLIKRDELLAAVWPLRMAAYNFCRVQALRLDVPYQSIRSIPDVLRRLEHADAATFALLDGIFLTSAPLPAKIVELYQATLGAFRSSLAGDG